MKCRLLFSIIAIFITSCNKDITTSYTANLINQTSTKITILPHRNGIVSDTIILYQGESFEIANGWEWGEVATPQFSSELLAINSKDSIIVLFNDSIRVVHYCIEPPIAISDKLYLFESERNIINRDNYSFKHEKIKKGGYVNTHEYTFTEADYEYAKR